MVSEADYAELQKEVAKLKDEKRRYAEHFISYKEGMSDRLTAWDLTMDSLVYSVTKIQSALDERNYGIAEDMTTEMLEDRLPNDHGGPVTHFPLFAEQLEFVRARRQTTEPLFAGARNI